MKHSTGTPTKAEAARIVAAKEGPCMACLVRWAQGLLPVDGLYWGCDYNHAKSGNKRRGHAYGYALCLWHHRKHPIPGKTNSEALRLYGPSMMDGSRLFHETYGSDDDLIDLQTETTGL